MDTQTAFAPASRCWIIAVAVAIFALVSADGKAEPQTSDVATHQARVVEVYGDKAVVEIKGRRFLVEPVAPGRPFPAGIGAEIQIVGQHRANVLIPVRIVLPSGAVVQASPGSGTPAAPEKDRTIENELAAHGITVSGQPYRRRNFTVVAGRTKEGRSVIASFDHNLRLVEIEDAEQHRHIHPNSPEALPEPEVAKLLAKQGYSSIRLLDQRRFRLLYSVSGPRDERMELLVDRGGNILRRVWLR